MDLWHVCLRNLKRIVHSILEIVADKIDSQIASDLHFSKKLWSMAEKQRPILRLQRVLNPLHFTHNAICYLL